MTRTLRAGDVEIDLGTGTWSVRWPTVGVSAGPFAARVHARGQVVRSDEAEGAWQVETGAAFGRRGAWARWKPRSGSPRVAVHVPIEGATVVVQMSYHAERDEQLDRLIPLAGTVELGAPVADVARLVDGYDSWSWSGVRSAAELGITWWNGAYVRGVDVTLGVQALDAARFATAIASRPERERLLLDVSCGATPPLEPVRGTWGYEVLPPAGLGLPLPAGAVEHSPPIALAAGSDPLDVVESLAELAGTESRARRWDGAPVTGWESWYHHGLLIDRQQLLANARRLREHYADRPDFNLVQLDDGWQVTYGSWWPNNRFPEDLAELTAELRALGCRSGLWLAPFMVQPGAPGLATEHADWMIRGDDGRPLADRHGRWGLDASNPEVVAWLRGLGRQVRAWGFDMVKLDFLYLAAVEGTRHDARVTGTESLRRGLRAMIDGLGDDVYVLTCGAPMLPVVGLCHGNRVGHDLAVPVRLREFGHPLTEGWTGFHGVRCQIRNVAARWALHRRWFDNDPDVVMAWGSTQPQTEGGYSLEESRVLTTMAALCGGPFLLADDLAALTDEERAVLEDPDLLDRAWAGGFRPLDLFDHVDDPAVEQYFAAPSHLSSRWRARDRTGEIVEIGHGARPHER